MVHIVHCVCQTSRAPDHRHSAKLHSNHLCQPAGFEHGGHQEHVAACIDDVAEGLVIREDQRCTPMELLHQLVPESVELSLHAPIWGRSQKHKLPAPLQRPPGRMFNEVDALLRYEPRNTPHDRHVYVCQVQAPSQLLPCGGLALDAVLVAIIHGQERVVLRVPYVCINAVADAVQLGQVRGNRPLAADLLCIRRRHCGGHVTCPHGPPHQVCSIAEVVDGEHAARVAAVSPGDVRGLPIVAVHDVGLYIVGVEVVQSGAAVELKPHSIVVAAIDASSPEVTIFRLQKGCVQALYHTSPHSDLCAPKSKRALLPQILNLLISYAIVLGDDDLHCMPFFLHSASQGCDHIAHAPHFSDRRHLHSYMHHL
mmetsp:Transcript_9834/g.26654  ORF Transcript_9834/g.26654 Transcript_9834/m.26654 type:complete len:368 (-) Transcript_9834:1425-2528(-)